MPRAWFLAVPLVLSACAAAHINSGSETSAPPSWATYLDHLGSFSSPRAADLNGDAVKDVVIGAGRLEFMATDSAVIALDGRNGRVLWTSPARDQVFGSATFLDVSRDGTPDVVIGGRSAVLLALDGRSGAPLWEFFPDSLSSRAHGFYEFFNAQVIPDQDGDGTEDLLTANGGDVLAAPGDPNRPVGMLMIISGGTGALIAAAGMPDGRETYMSPVVAEFSPGAGLEIIYGSGGETVGGHLYRTALSDLLAQDISSSVALASSSDRGFIGPPVLADITGDDTLDIIANAVDGRMLAIDGATNDQIWVVSMPGTEAYTSIGVGYFTGDAVPDFFASFALGRWPNLGWSRQLMVDGRSGSVAFHDSLGLYQTSSPVVADFNDDGRDEVLMSVNYQTLNEQGRKRFYTMLVAVDFATGEVSQFGDFLPGSNLSSTPWLGDLDEDGLVEVVYSHTPDTLHTYVFNGLQVNRIGTNISPRKPILWGSYMGSRHDGVFDTR